MAIGKYWIVECDGNAANHGVCDEWMQIHVDHLLPQLLTKMGWDFGMTVSGKMTWARCSRCNVA